LKAYFDTSALVAVYVTEAHSARARAEIAKHPAVPWTPLHDLEVGAALRLLNGRKLITQDERDNVFSHIGEDLDAGRLERPELDLASVFQRAVELSERHAAKTLARSLDILHVAAALELRCDQIVTGDERQIALAHVASLRAIDIRRRR